MDEKSIIRGKKHGFTVLYNSVLMDPRLDLKTKGLFAIIQSFPADWEYSVSGLAARVGIGRDGIRSCLRQLETAGYLLREQPHGEHGHFARTEFVFQDQAPLPKAPLTDLPSTVEPSTAEPSTAEPSTAEPSTAEPSPVNPTQVNKHLSKETKSNPPIPPKGAKAQTLFERFWKAYPRHDAKAKAEKAWDKLKPDLPLCRTMAAALEWQKQSESWQRDNGRYIPMAATWLNQRRWEDEVDNLPAAPTAPDEHDERRGRYL